MCWPQLGEINPIGLNKAIPQESKESMKTQHMRKQRLLYKKPLLSLVQRKNHFQAFQSIIPTAQEAYMGQALAITSNVIQTLTLYCRISTSIILQPGPHLRRLFHRMHNSAQRVARTYIHIYPFSRFIQHWVNRASLPGACQTVHPLLIPPSDILLQNLTTYSKDLQGFHRGNNRSITCASQSKHLRESQGIIRTKISNTQGER